MAKAKTKKAAAAKRKPAAKPASTTHPKFGRLGTAEKPIRISSLPLAANCPGLFMIRNGFSEVHPEEAGIAAETGSAIGDAIALWHKYGKANRAIKDALANASLQYPKADRARVERVAGAYMVDPRNAPAIVLPGSCELEVSFQLPGWEDDEPIYFQGHTDQIRVNTHAGRFELWDVKAGGARKGGVQTLLEYAWQLAGYTLAIHAMMEASPKMFGMEPWPIVCGGVIWLPAYERKMSATSPVEAFQTVNWTVPQCVKMLNHLRVIVYRLRRGEIARLPGPHCAWCEGHGPAACERLMKG